MFGANGNYRIFVTISGFSNVFDDLFNTNDTLMGYPIIPITICGDLVYTNDIGICIPARIYDYILVHHTAPTITHYLHRSLPKIRELKEEGRRDEERETPVLWVDKDGRFVKFFSGMCDVVKKYPEYNPDAVVSALGSDCNKVYGKYWSWDYMYYVRMELRHKGHVL